VKLDELMPVYDVAEAYSVRIAASPERVWNELLNADFTGLPVARRLMALRSFGRRKPPAGEPHTLATLTSGGKGGFIELARVPGEEIVLGVIGRFWRPDAPVLRDWKAAEFVAMSAPGQAKAAWNFSLRANAGATILSTETRVQCCGQAARIKFRLYWALIGFFSGWIRKEMLKMVRRNCESAAGLTHNTEPL
jgi:hypothetical protein